MFIEQRFNTFLAILIIAFSWSIAATTLAKDHASTQTRGHVQELGSKGPLWLWSETAPHSQAAARALGDGETARGIRLAHKALRRAEDKRGRLIAHHNLCVAYAIESRESAATHHCQEARRLADSGFVIASGFTPVSVANNAAALLELNLVNAGMPGFGQISRP